MRVSHRYKFIFFSNPKCGSETIRFMLDSLSDSVGIVEFPKLSAENPFYNHMLPREARDVFRRLGWQFDDYYKFTTVRDPWTRLASLYSHLRRVRRNAVPPFPTWLRSIATDGRGGGGHDSERWLKHGTYLTRNWVGDETATPLVDNIFRLEDIAALPQQLSQRGIPLNPGDDVPKRNVHRYEAADHTPETIVIVAGLYHEDILRFGYETPKLIVDVSLAQRDMDDCNA